VLALGEIQALDQHGDLIGKAEFIL